MRCYSRHAVYVSVFVDFRVCVYLWEYGWEIRFRSKMSTLVYYMLVCGVLWIMVNKNYLLFRVGFSY
jgi:hypothetical protein